ncbi:hypothetical protein DICVIV_08722 [Dictyocaulus viviparus]|uniref:Uncharacterized protein n=1 Tax=Dictyocaulus viviparus TaxID=29172 RepID=A0A0D8XNC3_DICVI|nr:hypothetical protein DICVIV_08722 [Dictyocaulus viviparus]
MWALKRFQLDRFHVTRQLMSRSHLEESKKQYLVPDKRMLTKNLDIRSWKRLICQRFHNRFCLYRIKSDTSMSLVIV